MFVFAGVSSLTFVYCWPVAAIKFPNSEHPYNQTDLQECFGCFVGSSDVGSILGRMKAVDVFSSVLSGQVFVQGIKSGSKVFDVLFV